MTRRWLLSLALFLSFPVFAQVPQRLQQAVDAAAHAVMERDGVPGLAVGVTFHGQRYVFNYGLAVQEGQRPVTDSTLFELGSISKIFTATLGAWAREQGRLSFDDAASRHWPALAGSAFDRITLLDLATYTAGGLPLQFPDDVTGADDVLRFYRAWQPAWAPGTQRLYANTSIGLFGFLAARSLGAPFDDLLQGQLFPALGLRHTFVRVPPQALGDYASGYRADGRPVRVNPGPLDAEAYGVKTTAADMLRVIEENMDGAGLDPKLQRALQATHQAYYEVPPLRQGLAWEMYDYPVRLQALQAGNAGEMAYQPHAVRRFAPPQAARRDVWLNKTGSTNGFGAYVAFVPAREAGVVVLGNKNFPVADRVQLAFTILQALDPALR